MSTEKLIKGIMEEQATAPAGKYTDPFMDSKNISLSTGKFTPVDNRRNRFATLREMGEHIIEANKLYTEWTRSH